MENQSRCEEKKGRAYKVGQSEEERIKGESTRLQHMHGSCRAFLWLSRGGTPELVCPLPPLTDDWQDVNQASDGLNTPA